MGKYPYLFRRNNKSYFRLIIPSEYKSLFNFKHITVSLKTEIKQEAITLALRLTADIRSNLHDLKTGKIKEINRSFLIPTSNVELVDVLHIENQQATVTSPPQLSFVINDFLKRYDQDHRAMFTKLSAALLPWEIDKASVNAGWMPKQTA
jgi:hypothetical protein